IHEYLLLFYFFFQAEDGIRDRNVTGVQTCALPIFGRGLEALFDESPQVQETEEITEISLDEIRPNPYQPRKTFDNKSLKELSESDRKSVVFQPIIIRKSVNGYEIIAGERRFRASKLAKKK